MSKLYAVYRGAVKTLTEAGVEEPEFDARVLVEHCFGYDGTRMLLNMQSPVDEEKERYFNECVIRRKVGEPLQYIVGEWGFHKFTFSVKPDVLIPRPETELLVDFAVKNMRNPRGVIFDLCTGSGCIGISVAKLLPGCKIYCVDISDSAVALANENKERLEADNVTVVKGDLFEGIEALRLPQPDMILSNPPYIVSDEIDSLQKEVQFEPRLALDGGIDGLKFYRALAEKWFPYLVKGGFLAMECGENQATDILSMFLKTADGAKLLKDTAEIERVVVIKR